MNKIKAILQNEKLAPLIQFIKFGLVGVSNTAISYGVEMLCYYVLFKNSEFIGILSFLSRLGISTDGNNVKIVITTIIAFVISVTNSYFWNNRYVFGSGKKSFSEHFKTYFRTFACYGITGLILSPIIKILLTKISVPFFIASLGALVITIPLNFVMNKFWAFKSKPTKDEKDEDKTC